MKIMYIINDAGLSDIYDACFFKQVQTKAGKNND